MGGATKASLDCTEDANDKRPNRAVSGNSPQKHSTQAATLVNGAEDFQGSPIFVDRGP